MEKATNSLIKELRRLKKETSLLFLDNLKIIKDAIAKGVKPLYILVDDEKLNIWGEKYHVYKTDSTTIKMLADTVTPQGVVCVAEYIQHMVEKPTTNFLVLDGIQDPGNAGTLIRTACACGFKSIFMLDCVSVRNSKLVRSSVGTIFDEKIYEVPREKFIELASKWQLCLLKADMHGENIFKKSFTQPVGVVMGNEGNGISDEISKLCTLTVSIPMEKEVESLNVATSGSIIMYQIAKDLFDK